MNINKEKKQTNWLPLFLLCIYTFPLNLFAQYVPLKPTLSSFSMEDSSFYSVKPFYIKNAFKDTNVHSNYSLLYKKIFKEHILEFKNSDYYIRANVYIDYFYQKENNLTFINTNSRGFNFEGKIGRLSFYSTFFENQIQAPNYINDYAQKYQIFPSQGFNGFMPPNKYDFSYSLGGVAYNFNRFFTIQLAQDKIFIGNGYRSVLLSDNSVPYPYIRLTSNIGKFQMTNLYAQCIDKSNLNRLNENSYPKKFFAAHLLEFKLKKWTIGIFENVIWKDQDSNYKRGFELAYINPVILYRPVEYTFGSSDNVGIGFNIKNDLSKTTTVYGQLFLDEFKFNELIINNKGWWGNKYAIQLGIKTKKYLNNPNLAALFEFNMVRPYTYSHESALLSFTNSNEPLAHPAGANFIEFVHILTYTKNNYYVIAHINFLRQGIDYFQSKSNVGQNVFLSYNTRNKEYNNSTLQGIQSDILFFNVKGGYILNEKNNLRVEFEYIYRKQTIENVSNSVANIFSIGIKSSFRSIYYDK